MDPNVEGPRAPSTTRGRQHDSAGLHTETQIETIGEHLLRTGPVEWDTNLENDIPVPPRESRQRHCLSRVQSTQTEHERTGST